jgi:hypothetical protein
MQSREQPLVLLRRRPAVHLICIGSWIQTPLELGDEVMAVPLAPLGFAGEVHYLAQYVVQIVGAGFDATIAEKLIAEASESNPVVALCARLTVDAEPHVLEEFASARLKKAQQVLSWISAREVSAIGVVVATTTLTHVRPLPPPYENRRFLFGIGGSREQFQETVLAVSRRAAEDERFAFALSLYHDALKEPNAEFRIARMFNVLEALAFRIKAHVQGTRRAVKRLLGLADDARAEMAYEDSRYRFDPIEIAGRLRAKLFHGVPFRERDLNAELRPVFALLRAHADDVAKIIGGYCELELNRWARGTSKGQVIGFTGAGRAVDPWKTIQALYESEINVGLAADHDRGFKAWLGVGTGPPVTERMFSSGEFGEIANWLDVEAKRLFPDSRYARG